MDANEAAEFFRNPPNGFIDVGAGEVAYRRVGNGPDVLFVHGWPVSGATFRTLLPFLNDHFTCHIIDFPGAGDSRFDEETPLSIRQHIITLGRVIDALNLGELAVVGHDSGGLIARHAVVDRDDVRALALVDTEQSNGLSWRFRSFLQAGRLPGFGRILGWTAGHPRVRRTELVLGGAFCDRRLLDGEFDEFFLAPLHTSPERLRAAIKVLDSFDVQLVDELAAIHRRLTMPVTLVWGERDPFFPVARTREMVGTFAQADLTVVPDAKLFSHEEHPAAVAAALIKGMSSG